MLVVDCVAERKEAGDMVQSVEVSFIDVDKSWAQIDIQEKPKASSIISDIGNALNSRGKRILHGKRRAQAVL